MGATKRMAEMVALSAGGSTFRPVAVRFGNIIGSSGSLVEIMARCIKAGLSTPITHPAATRFFMTAGEAVSLVLKDDLTGRRAVEKQPDKTPEPADLRATASAANTTLSHARFGREDVDSAPGPASKVLR